MLRWPNRSLAFWLSCPLLIVGAQAGCAYAADPPTPTVVEAESSGQLDQLVAPIALYPDGLVAQILAASAEPSEIIEADRWMQQHAGMSNDSLVQAIDKQPWDPSVKGLMQFPVVLANMDRNLSWTSSLGDAYVNQQQDVFNAIQAMRRRAQQSGYLEDTMQEIVTIEGPTISIEPEDTELVYVPQYDPWLVYGAPVAAYPDWAPYPGLFLDGPGVGFDLAFDIGAFGAFDWGWHAWGTDWHDHRLTFKHDFYRARDRTFERGDLGYVGEFRGGTFHDFAALHGQPAIHSGVFSGFDRGGMTRAYSFRGQASFGSGGYAFAGGFHGGEGGGFHGGGEGVGFHGGGGEGFHGGGGHR
jgi:hypothetical protein